MLITIALCAICGALIYDYLVWNFSYWQKLGVPGPIGHLVTGSFPRSFFQQLNLVYEVNEVYKRYRHQTPFFGYYSSRTPALMVLDPAVVKSIFVINFKSFHDNDIVLLIDTSSDSLLSRHPFRLRGEEWKEKRSEFLPAFTTSKLKSMYPIMENASKKLTSYIHMKLKEKPDGLDAKDMAAKFTAEIISKCVFGIDSLALSGECSVVSEMGSQIANFPFSRTVYFALIQCLPWIYNVYRVSLVPKAVLRFFENITRDAMDMRNQSVVKRDDFLNFLLQLREKKGLSDREMAANTMTFFLDGYETSSYVLSNVLNRLAANPAIQSKLRLEIEEAVQTVEDISFSKIHDLQYLDQVFHESLRIDPVVGFATKKCTEDTELTDYKGKTILVNVGTPVHIPVYLIHHDSEYYPNPEEFDPERFSPENGGLKAYKDKGVFLAFGDGPRHCIGMRFGTLQVKVAVVEILRNFTLNVNPKTKSAPVFDPSKFLLTPIGGNWLDFKPRTKGV